MSTTTAHPPFPGGISSLPDSKKRNTLTPFILAVLTGEALILTFVPIDTSVPTPTEPKAIHVTLAAPPKPPAPKPKPIPKPRAKPKIVKHHVVSHPVTPPTLPVQTATSTNLLVAQTGTKVDLGWGSGTPAAGAASDYQPPHLLTKVDTNSLYTDKMKATDEEGDVVIDLWIDPSGKLVRYKMVVPSVYDDMNRIAKNVLKTLRFDPARIKGKAVNGKFELNFRFRIQNSG
ncbi:MAG: TonB family protein [Leptospirales bacterium]